MQSLVVLTYHPRNSQKNKFPQGLRDRSLIYAPTTYIIWDDFKESCAFIESSQKLEAYAFKTCFNLTHFFGYWGKCREFKYMYLIGLNCTLPMC